MPARHNLITGIHWEGQEVFTEIASAYHGEIAPFRPYAPASSRPLWEGLPGDLQASLILAGEQRLGYAYPALPATLYMEFCRIGNRSHYEASYFARRSTLCTFVLAECVENKGRFMDDIINGIVTICEESGWQLPAHNWAEDRSEHFCMPDTALPVVDLFACETAAMLSIAAYLLRDKLDAVTPLVTERIAREIDTRILTPYLTRHFHWMGEPGEDVNNWTPWCTQNVLIAAYALPEVGQDTRRKILAQAAKSMDIFLDVYGEDGCCNEGAGYYRAAGLCLFNTIEVLDAVTGDAFRTLYDDTKVKNIAPYIMNMHVGDRYYANFADCAPTAGRAGAREFLYAKRVGNEDMMRYAAKDHALDGDAFLSQGLGINLFYRLQGVFTEAEMRAYDTTLPIKKQDLYYESVGLMIARDDRFFLAVKAGHNDDSHNHNDTGSFTVYKDGKPLLIDVGVETYSRKTFSKQRYEIWTMQSAYHNLLTFGDVMQQDGRAFAASEVDVSLTEQEAGISMELSGAYPDGTVGSYRRTVRFVKGEDIRVTDACDPLPKGTYLSLMTQLAPAYAGGKLSIGELGSVMIEGSDSVEIERIDVQDAKLQGEWGNVLYRTKVRLDKPSLSLVIA